MVTKNAESHNEVITEMWLQMSVTNNCDKKESQK